LALHFGIWIELEVSEANRVPLYVPGELLSDVPSRVQGAAKQAYLTRTVHGGVLINVAVASVRAKNAHVTPTPTPIGNPSGFRRMDEGRLGNATGHKDFVQLSRGPAPMEFLRGVVDQAIGSIRASGRHCNEDEHRPHT
jgi:hypothetical protein